jgi:large subunit ribosomal protein L18
MILSNVPRFVVRSSLKHTAVQIINAHSIGDRTLVSVSSQEISKEFGWKAYCRNLPMAYLVGFLIGHKALSQGIDRTIFDIGLKKASKGGRVFATLKGAVDAGLNMQYNAKIMPSESRIRGEHIVSFAKKLFEDDPLLYEKTFSKYLSRNLKPEHITEHFEEVKRSITNVYTKEK